jgi:hypothetical protein
VVGEAVSYSDGRPRRVADGEALWSRAIGGGCRSSARNLMCACPLSSSASSKSTRGSEGVGV